ncbi:hypothetical protein AVEN_143818-1 [Araneus ventricosus]|uniref:Uncharacterized protein n=1 Tax=Araneus ventricosus TaxID=182803 RepID=A0A4Y2TN71_ARAVE|nr:hypothetical protein AVEN_143818-1 [Araneus ventricosus]
MASGKKRELKKKTKNSIRIGRNRLHSDATQMAFRLVSFATKNSHNKKSNLERHFTTKHTQFAGKYPTGDARKKAVEELKKKQQSSFMLSNWAQSSNNVNLASFAVSLEIAKRGKPFTDDKESSKLLHFKNLKQYRIETNATIEANYFSIALKNMKDGFAVRFEQFKTNKSTHAFIVNSLSTNTNEINIEPFGIDAGSLQMQLLDLKNQRLLEWQVLRTQEQVGRVENAYTPTSGQL